uniref:Phosphofurin acidic cluster sorting protein 2 n=1 Tax=Romanomermis culicivorax TaxID=13658 RepID=A0A915JPB0_ROMCU
MIEQNRVFPMRLYATWEVDRTSSSCVPRSCVVAFDRLTILRNVVEQQRDNSFLTSIIVAVKLQAFVNCLIANCKDSKIFILSALNDVKTVFNALLGRIQRLFTDEAPNGCSTQIFVPFVGDVRLGASIRMDSFGDESQTSAAMTSNAAAADVAAAVVSPATSNKNQEFSPPGSPRFHADAAKSPSQNFNDVQDLQIEYWTQNAQSSTVQQPNAAVAVLCRKDTQNLLATPPLVTSSALSSVAAGSTLIVKQSVKTGFRSLTVSRVPPASNLSSAPAGDSGFLTLNFIREKKRDKVLQKLGMKKGEKDQQEKKHTVENVSRLICSSTKQHGAMKVYIDGVEWSQVKFFQISTQWQTHVKFLPLALFNID